MKILGSKKLKETVKLYLIKHKHLRDNDYKLVASIWWNHLGGANVINKMSASDLLSKLAEGNMPSSDAITRWRRKLQEMHPLLRGSLWYERHKMQEQVKIELREVK